MNTIFLALDYVVGIADQQYAEDAVARAVDAIEVARGGMLPVIYSRIGFRPGHPEVSPRNRTFGPMIGSDQYVGARSRLVDQFRPRADEPVVEKKRYSAFAGSDLGMLLRARDASRIVMCGLVTSGVVLSTALALTDDDFDVTILRDACADPDRALHDAVLDGVLAERATVAMLDDWRRSRT